MSSNFCINCERPTVDGSYECYEEDGADENECYEYVELQLTEW